MPSPWRVLQIASGSPAWPAKLETGPCVQVLRDVRAAQAAIVAGSVGEAVARAVHERRRADPEAGGEKPAFDDLPPQEKASLNSLAGHVRAAQGAGRVIRGD